jgi:hypothetical protein
MKRRSDGFFDQTGSEGRFLTQGGSRAAEFIAPHKTQRFFNVI